MTQIKFSVPAVPSCAPASPMSDRFGGVCQEMPNATPITVKNRLSKHETTVANNRLMLREE